MQCPYRGYLEMSPVASSGARHVNTSANKLDLTLTQTCKPCWLCWESEWRGQYTDLYSFHKLIKNLCYLWKPSVKQDVSTHYYIGMYSLWVLYTPLSENCVYAHIAHVSAPSMLPRLLLWPRQGPGKSVPVWHCMTLYDTLWLMTLFVTITSVTDLCDKFTQYLFAAP